MICALLHAWLIRIKFNDKDGLRGYIKCQPLAHALAAIAAVSRAVETSFSPVDLQPDEASFAQVGDRRFA